MNKYDFGEVKKGSMIFDRNYYENRAKRLNEQEGILHLKDNYNCKECKNKGVIYELFRDNEIVSIVCGCMSERKIKHNVATSGLEKQFTDYTFSNFFTREQHSQTLFNKAKSYLKELHIGLWWVVVGQVGSGKTHITTAIVNELSRSGKSFKYMRYASEMPRLQRGMMNFNPVIKDEAETQFNMYKTVDILYIDDFMKTRNTDYVFELIDYRYSNGLTTLITTELSYGEQKLIDEAVASRIYELAGSYYISIASGDDKNYRLGGYKLATWIQSGTNYEDFLSTLGKEEEK